MPCVLFAVTGGSGAWPGMGHELYRTEPVFRESIEACCRIVEALSHFDLAESFRRAPEASGSTRDELIYRVEGDLDWDLERYVSGRRKELIRLGVLQIALCDLWRSLGVRPGGTIGISLGEVVAAYAAGALSRDDAVTVLVAIADGVSERPTEGLMFTVGVDRSSACSLCANAPGRLELLGTLAPTKCLMLTTRDDGPAVRAFIAQEAPFVSEFPTPWGYHTMRGMCDRRKMEEALLGVSARPHSCPIFSAAAGRVLEGAQFDGRHWHWMASHQFFYDEALADALRQGFEIVISIGANPEQKDGILSTAEQLGARVSFIDSMRQDEPELATWHQSVESLRELAARNGSASSTPSTTPHPSRRPPPSTAATLKLDDPAVAQDPFAHYEELRRTGSVHFLPRHQTWLVLGYDDVLAAFSRPQLFSSHLKSPVDPVLLGADGKTHAGVRRALAGFFSQSAVARLMPDIEAFAEQLLSPVVEGKELEVVRDFAAELANYTAARLLRLDDESATALILGIGAAEVETLALFESLAAAIERVVDASGLATELLAKGAFDAEQMRSLLRVLWIAATSTTKRFITSSIRLLAEDFALQCRLRRDPTLLDVFLDESIRLHPPELLIGRMTTARVTLGGVEIPEGSPVQLCIGAANRDPRRFAQPQELRLDRTNSHIAFGSGAHGCPGERLARAEARSALIALLRITPLFESVQPHCMFRYVTASTTHGLQQLVIAPVASTSAQSQTPP